MTDLFRDVYDRFDPEGAPRDRAWIADRQRSPARDIARRLELSIGDGRFLLVGTVGSGKSTELVRIAEARARDRFVVSLDLIQHFTHVVGDAGALQHVRTWEVVFLAALAVARAASERLDFEFGKSLLPDLEAAWRRAASKSGVPDVEAEIDLGKLAKSMVILASSAAGGPAGGAAAATILSPLDATDAKWKLPIGRSKKSLEDQTDEIQSLLRAANAIFGSIQHRHDPVLLVLDGLDRVEDRSPARSLFGDSAILSQLACNSVVSGPFVLRHDLSLASVRGFDVKVLVNEPVLDKEHPQTVRGPGVQFLVELFRQRTKGMQLPIREDIVADLAHASGGRLRDFVKLVREVAAQVLLARASTVEPSHVEAAIREQRLLLETGLDVRHLNILRSVMEDGAHRLPGDDAVGELLRTSKLLPYPDGSEWYYPHALLLRGQLLV